MSQKLLSEDCRQLLHSLIHGDDHWWQVVSDKAKRDSALDTLLSFRLLEIHQNNKVCRATKRGIRSNEKLLATGWRP